EQFSPDFLKIAPNNRMPAIVDPQGPGGRSISIFESGAVLQYLGRKTGKFYPADERARVEGDQWLFWQMGGVGPMAGQVHHFRNYALETLTYAINRYVNEVNRLYGVMNIRLRDRPFIAGKYSIADMALVGWVNGWERQGQGINEFPNLKRWLEAVKARPAGKAGIGLWLGMHQGTAMKAPKVQAGLVCWRARASGDISTSRSAVMAGLDPTSRIYPCVPADRAGASGRAFEPDQAAAPQNHFNAIRNASCTAAITPGQSPGLD